MLYQEAFYTYRTTRQTAVELLAEFNTLQEAGDYDQAELRKIEMHLSRGHEHFDGRRYHPALKDYLKARSLIYQMLQPRTPTYPGFDAVVAVRQEDFPGLMAEVVERLRRYQPEWRLPIPEPIDPIDPPPDLIVSQLQNLGIQDPSPSIDEAAGQINLGVDLARSGQLSQAESQFRLALEQLEPGQIRERAYAQENLGIVLAQQGNAAQAGNAFEEAAQLYNNLGMQAQQAGVLENHGAMLTQYGNLSGAVSRLRQARDVYETVAGGGIKGSSRPLSERPSARTPAAETFTPKAGLLNAALDVQTRINQVNHIRNRGNFFGRLWRRFVRSIEAPPTPSLQMEFRAIDVPETAASTAEDLLSRPTPSPERRLRLFVGQEELAGDAASRSAGSRAVVLDYQLAQADTAQQIQTDYYERRVKVTTLEALGMEATILGAPMRFELDLPHHYYYSIHLSLGKVYTVLGRFEDGLSALQTARDYRYLNHSIEVPYLWIATAELYLAWGNHLYRQDERPAAREKYLTIIVVEAEQVSLDETSELYAPAVYADVKSQIESLLSVLEEDTEADINPQMEMIVRQAYQRLRMIEEGLNWFGTPADQVTIFRFKYLEAVARYFAEQAIKAERDYINYWTNKEREEQQMNQLLQAVELANDTVEFENRRIAEAQAMVNVAQRSVDTANVRLTNAQARRDQYSTLGRDLIALDTATAHASGGFTETEGGYDVYLHSEGEVVDLGDEDYIIMRNAARRRGEIRYEIELANMTRGIAELQARLAEAAAQRNLADTRLAIAQQGAKIARARQRHALANLEYARNKVFTTELWHNLGNMMREIADTYLERAIDIARLMEQAYNFEFDQSLRIIKNNYTSREELSGLLAGNMLLLDIDYFTYHRLTQVVDKAIPAKIYWSLGERYPYLIYEFRRTGHIQFEIQVEDLDELYPGTYLRKLIAVEVVVEGLIGADGIHGTLTNSGISVYKNRDGSTNARIQPRETMLLSAHNLRQDVSVFRPSEEVRGVFEGSGISSSWTLEIPPGTNDLNYDAVRDIRIVFYLESFYDGLLAETVKAQLPTTGTWSRSYSTATEFPDAFFYFQDNGELTFDVRVGDFPYHHSAFEIATISVLFLPDETHGRVASLYLKRSGEDDPDPFTTDANTGIFASDETNATNPLNAYIGESPLAVWVLSMDFETNPDFVDTDPQGSRPPRLVGIKDIVITIEYNFQRRTVPVFP